MTIKRIVFNFFLIGAIFYVPWWVVLIFAIFGIFYFRLYYEVLIVGIFLDILYTILGDGFLIFSAPGFLTAIILFIVIERIKSELR